MKKQIIGRASAILPTATAALLALLAATTATHAQTDTTWTRGNSTNNWNESANWSAGVPVAGFNAIFGASVGGAPSEIITLAMDKITFATGGASYTAQFQNLPMHLIPLTPMGSVLRNGGLPANGDGIS